MEVKQDNFYVTLFSTASSDIYTWHSQTSFTNRLVHPIDLGLSSNWEGGLADITYKQPTRSVILGTLIDVISSLNFLICCDLFSPQLVGSDLKRLLRTIICPSQLGKHQFQNIYYLPVDKKEFTNIHREMSILNQDTPIAYFDADSTIPSKVVLHFRRTKWEMLPAGIDTCPKFWVNKIVITEVLVRWGGRDSEFDSWIPVIYLRKYGYPKKPVLCDTVQQRLEGSVSGQFPHGIHDSPSSPD